MTIFLYESAPHQILSSNVRTLEANVDRLARTLRTGLQNATPITLRYPPTDISLFAELRCDKWVEDIGGHFTKYSQNQRPALLTAAGSNGMNHQSTKSLSGDVHGTIGEAVFSMVLTKHYRLPLGHYAHLRSAKVHRTPDFELYGTTPGLQALFNAVPSSFTLPFPAEVKTMRLTDQIPERLISAAGQIQAYWEERQQVGFGLIALCIRNQESSAYDLAVVAVH